MDRRNFIKTTGMAGAALTMGGSALSGGAVRPPHLGYGDLGCYGSLAISIENTNHPQIGYWFLTPPIIESGKYMDDLDAMIDNTYLDFFFLDAREGANFEDTETMHKVVANIVERAHERNVKIGMRTFLANDGPLEDRDRERFLGDKEVRLDSNGQGSCVIDNSFIRDRSTFKNGVYKIYAFEKTDNGFYDPTTLTEVEDYTFEDFGDSVQVKIDGGKELAERTAFVMAEFIYNSAATYGARAVQQAIAYVDLYGDIPLDGIMLDELRNRDILPWHKMFIRLRSYRNRHWSVPMAEELERRTGEPAGITMLHMRFAPEGKEALRMRAINTYMDLLREGPLRVENAVYDHMKKTFGPDCFMSAHSTFHNNLDMDEIWHTGIDWWTVPREYGHSDENTALPVQMGIAMAYKQNAMYNMYYDQILSRFEKKALTDLRYGIRTHYHAFNDTKWGVNLNKPKVYSRLNPVEKSARLLNRFNPSLPDIKLLVVFGVEALQNWYPNESARNRYDINGEVRAIQRAKLLWNAGYLNALVPTDLINNGTLRINEEGKPEMNGHTFDAVIFLHPQYSKEKTLSFLEEYVNGGGKLMIEGEATHGFQGNDIALRFKQVAEKATITSFDLSKLDMLGIGKNAVNGGCLNEDGSYVFTDITSHRSGKQTIFKIMSGGHEYSAFFSGFAAIDAGEGLSKFTASGFTELRKNGEVILSLSLPGDIYVEKTQVDYIIELIDPEGTNKVEINAL